MGNVGGFEVVVVLLVALVVLGPEKLPEAVRKFGNVVGELRRVSKSFQDEMRSAAMLDDSSVEAAARKNGEAAVAASQQNQDQMEQQGRSLTEGTEPFVNTGSPDNPGSHDAEVDADLDSREAPDEPDLGTPADPETPDGPDSSGDLGDTEDTEDTRDTDADPAIESDS